jgi:hypothetical protein
VSYEQDVSCKCGHLHWHCINDRLVSVYKKNSLWLAESSVPQPKTVGGVKKKKIIDFFAKVIVQFARFFFQFEERETIQIYKFITSKYRQKSNKIQNK